TIAMICRIVARKASVSVVAPAPPEAKTCAMAGSWATRSPMAEARLPKTAPSAVSPIHHQTSVGRLGELGPARRGEPACPVGGSAGVEVAAQREADAEERDRETAGGAGVRAELCGHDRHRQAGPATEHTGGHQLGLSRVLVGAAV